MFCILDSTFNGVEIIRTSSVYYLTATIFKTDSIDFGNGKTFEIKVENYSRDQCYIQSAHLNGKELNRNWLMQKELTDGGTLILTTSNAPNTNWGIENQWISSVRE